MRRLYVIFMSVFFIGACSIDFGRWSDSDFESRRSAVKGYTVHQDDTLYAIAWLHNLDYRDIAKWNDIAAPKYVIYPGQHLRLFPPLKPQKPKHGAAKVVRHAKRDTARPPQSKLRWSWPLDQSAGSTSYLRGVNIKGQPDQPVLAAANGTVVYSGFGLKHYGGLVIIRHPGDFFSAYGFVGNMTVQVTDKIKQGQTIAYLPSRGEAKLYFDIRHRGRQLDPLKYLPTRN